ncbi:MAG: aromatic ring-hydroxylating dioxygenase subunit alpha [Gammaproteobacteria bacterium]|nr:aromatic ring-hydroxylating dioxygenase subunit alpha [Gammaproteobacteria bacterium]
MRADERIRVLNTLREGIASGTSHSAEGVMRSPLSDFTSRSLLEQEQSVFFRDTPLLMGLSTDLNNPGDYWADSKTGVPILMVRDDDGKFHAFANMCRHRGAQVVPDGRGNRNQFSCPFHAWTYNKRGNLIAINKEKKFGCVAKDDHSLVEFPSAEKYGMLWVKPSLGGEIDVDACLSGLEEDMEAWELNSHPYAREQDIHANTNWKLAIDTFGENYHFDVLHSQTLAPSIRGNLQTHDVYGKNYRMVFAYQHFDKVAEKIPQMKDWPMRFMTLTVYFIYPNVILLVDPGGVDVLRIFPEDNQTNKSVTCQRWYLNPQSMMHFMTNSHELEDRFIGFNAVIQNEDYRVAESTQRTADSGLVDHILFGMNEPALHHYHNAHREGLGREALQLQTAV